MMSSGGVGERCACDVGACCMVAMLIWEFSKILMSRKGCSEADWEQWSRVMGAFSRDMYIHAC